jgi:hypothetical protein
MRATGHFLVATITVAMSGSVSFAEQREQPNAPTQELASVNYLIGTWSCAHTVGTFSGRYTTTYSKALGDRWLKQIWDFPAQDAGNRNQGSVIAESLMGFDEQRQSWVRFFANSLGQHFEIRITDTPNGWSYKYATFFPRKTPETAAPDAIFTKKSETEYTVDGPTYPQGTVMVTKHHTCHKL